jgi:hypothetical protein
MTVIVARPLPPVQSPARLFAQTKVRQGIDALAAAAVDQTVKILPAPKKALAVSKELAARMSRGSAVIRIEKRPVERTGVATTTTVLEGFGGGRTEGREVATEGSIEFEVALDRHVRE